MKKYTLEKIKHILENLEGDASSRNAIFEKWDGPKLELSDVLRHPDIKDECITSTMPVEFNRLKMINAINALIEGLTDTKEDIITLKENVEDASNDVEKLVNDDIDATHDNTLKPLIKTASYFELEELIVPDAPVNVYIAGETGVGKSAATLDIGKNLNMPVVRVSLSYATDVDDLMGGLRLDGGDTEFEHGPVIEAMKMGAILLLDEVDSANPRILMELQAVLEGKGVLIKKTKQMIYPHPQFRVIATGNSKGSGDVTGKHVGVGPLNRAFLDRFAAFITYDRPTVGEMEQILDGAGLGHSKMLNRCVALWYDLVSKAAESGSIPDSIGVRRVVDICKLMKTFKVVDAGEESAIKALGHSLNIFDESTKGALVGYYESMLGTTRQERERILNGEPEPEEHGQMHSVPAHDENGNAVPY